MAMKVMPMAKKPQRPQKQQRLVQQRPTQQRPTKEEEIIVKTIFDDIATSLEAAPAHELPIDELSKRFNVSAERLEALAKILSARQIIEIVYPVSPLAKPLLRLTRVLEWPKIGRLKGLKCLSSYRVEAAKVPASVVIWELPTEPRPIYEITIAKPGPYTDEALAWIRDELAREIPILTEEITDPKLLARLKERFQAAASEAIERHLPEISSEKKEILSGILLHRMYGLGDVELLMADDLLEEIAVNTSIEPISVYHKKFGWIKTTLRIPSEEEIYNYASQIGRKAGREITLLNPVLDAPLITGDRVAATLFPISSLGNTITVRKFARAPWTITQFMHPSIHSLNSEMAAFLWLATAYEINLLVTGGTATGKTSALNVITTFIPPAHRIVSCEDVREINLPKHLRWNWVPLVTRGPNPEGKGEVSYLDLMITAMRMRPDRIIVGEVRRRREAEVMFEAMHTGHSVYCTLHADNAAQAIRRLTEPPIEIPSTELQALQLIATMFRDRRTGIRRVSEIVEIVPSPAAAGEVALNTIYRWRPRTDTFEKVGESARVFGDIALHTGMTLDEIKRDLGDRQVIIEWAARHALETIDDIGALMITYYKDPQAVLNAAQRDAHPKEVLMR